MTMLSVENLSLHYGAAQALRGVSVEAAMGEVTCVLGRNGVGKTSLLRAIAGHRPISGGSIRLDGQAMAQLGEILVRQLWLKEHRSRARSCVAVGRLKRSLTLHCAVFIVPAMGKAVELDDNRRACGAVPAAKWM